MKVHMHTKFCLICLLTFIFHQCSHCHEERHDHGPEESQAHNHNDYQISEASYLQNGGTVSAPSKFSVLEAENEQKYYIEKLFDHYGENGRLSFFGLEKLLISLGLGEIKVVEINHEDIGHDHVSHLDILEVQEGKHSHSHNHLHSHSHSGAENQTGISTKRNHKCDSEKETTRTSVKLDSKHVHDHIYHHHRHHHLHHQLEHNGTRHFRNESVSHNEHGEQNHEPSTETNTTQEQPDRKRRKHKKRRKGKKIGETLGDTAQDFVPDHEPDDQYEHNHVHKHDHVHDGSHLHVHLHEHDNDRATSHGHQDPSPSSEDGYHHTSKREAPHKQINVKKHAIFSARSHKDHGEDDHEHEEVSANHSF